MSKRPALFHKIPFWSIGLVLGLVMLAAATAGLSNPVGAAASQQDTGPDNELCLSCHSKPGMILDFEDGQLLLTIDTDAFAAGVHGHEEVSCTSCHTDITAYPHPQYQAETLRDLQLKLHQVVEPACAGCHSEQATNAMDSIHQEAQDEGNKNAAVCADCHNPHYQTRITDAVSGKITSEARAHIPVTCARCHSGIYNEYQKSVHGDALLREGNTDVPTCIDCHGVHNIQNPLTAEFHNNTPEMCASCHSDATIMDKYGLSTDVLETYVSDFHGTTVLFFDETGSKSIANKAVCTDCHGIHDIYPVDDPSAGIAVKKNLLVKCQACHPDATSDFPDSWLGHYIPSPEKNPIVYYVNLFYKILIPLVIGGMAIFVISDFVRRLIERRKGAEH